MEDGPCSRGLWDGWDTKKGVSIHLSLVRDCCSSAQQSCAPCQMLQGIVDHLRPEWMAAAESADQEDDTHAIIIRRRERWLFNSNMKLLGGTEAIRLVEGGSEVGEFQLYQAVTGA